MSLMFGMANLTVSGIALARLQNVQFNISYDSAQLRGGSLIFPTDQQLYNGSIEGSFEQAEINLTSLASMLGVTGADIAFANGSGTMKISATTVLMTGADVVVSCVTNGVTGTLTFKNCKFDQIGVTLNREEYTIPTTNFKVCGDANGLLMTFQI